jgi:hypothetical protein
VRIANVLFVAQARPGGQAGGAQIGARVELRAGRPLFDGWTEVTFQVIDPALAAGQAGIVQPLRMPDQPGQVDRE